MDYILDDGVDYVLPRCLVVTVCSHHPQIIVAICTMGRRMHFSACCVTRDVILGANEERREGSGAVILNLPSTVLRCDQQRRRKSGRGGSWKAS
jgi:hypothetical protein